MTVAEKNIVEAYIAMFDNFNSNLRSEILKRIGKNTDATPITKEKEMNGLEKSFGAWEDVRSAEEIIADINGDLNFSEKVIEL